MIEANRKQHLVTEIKARAHTLLSGLSEASGGHDEGLNPHEILEAALAACTIMTAELYADRKQIALEGVDVNVAVVKEGKQTEIARTVSFRGTLTDENLERLTAIINKCPIHNLLESEVHIGTTIRR